MNSGTIFQIALTVLLWAATYLFWQGQGKALGVGYNLLPIKEKSSQSEAEIERQCRYIARKLLLPIAIAFTILTYGEVMETAWWAWMRSYPWLGILSYFILFGYVFFIISRVNSGKYKK